MNNNSKNNIQKLLLTIAIVMVINIAGSPFFHRFDLTKD